ncbi:hypothetical protein BANRA_01187 [Acinetobacter baumannii]|nr:hypothetical protein BANRA_02586 [Acinetobacter baumannii]VCX44949.1 hypothetical protein BANRA_01187 [Acinetobacter baumannii]
MPISPLLASFYLNDFDEWLIKKKYKHVRYADDLIFFLTQKSNVKKSIEKFLKSYLN